MLQWRYTMVAVLLVGCQTPAPPMPVQIPPQPRLSYLNIAIHIPLDSLAVAVDRELPRLAGVEPFQQMIDGGSNPPACGVDAGYSVGRGPLGMSGSGSSISTGFELKYWLQGRKQLPCPGDFMIASCGTDGEQPRVAKVSIDTAIAILPDLGASVNSSVDSIIPADRCVLNPIGIDVTDNLVSAFQETLKPVLTKLDQRLAEALQLQQRMKSGWERMSEPAELRPGIWLSLNPEGLGIVPLTASGGELHTGIQVRLRPVVTAGGQPETQAKPLPQADVVAPADTFELQIPVEVEQSFVQARLDKALDLDGAGTTVSLGSYNTRVTSADVQGQGSQVMVTVVFKGDINGTAILKGTPYYYAGADTLSFPDLDYTLDTDRFLLDSANAVAQGQIRDRLRSRFTIEMARPVDNLKQGLEKVLNRRRGNVQLHGMVREMDLVGVYRLPNGKVFTAYLAAKGTLSAEIDAQ